MKTNKLFKNSAVVTALLASLCCITPVLAVLGGLGGVAATFSFLEPLRPYFVGMTALVLGFAFYNAYKPKKENSIDCACEDETVQKKYFINSGTSSFWLGKKFLWMITVVSALLITFPYYSKAFFLDAENNIVVAKQEDIAKVKMEIEGMTCSGCEESVNYALQLESGVINATSSYKTGIAFVEYDKTRINSEQLKNAVEEKVGYKVKEIKIIIK